jgi:glucose/arabinose dehydrogenase
MRPWGEEINRIIPGGNFGWPLYTNGLDYNGEPATIG